MIEPLKRIIVEDMSDGTQVTRLPNNREVMDKINEIIKYINQQEDVRMQNLFKSRKES